MDTPDLTTLKQCRTCGALKPHAYEYFPLSRGKVGSECRVCKLERGKAWYEANKERLSLKASEYRATHKEQSSKYGKAWYRANKERHAAKSKAWRLENADRHAELNRTHYESNKELRAKQTKAWREANPDKVRTYSHNRRARKKNAEGSCTVADLTAIRAAQTDSKGRLICWRCGNPIKGTPHLDHWIPLNKGGSDGPGNKHYMHARCNRTKADKLPTEIGRLI